MTPHDQLRYQEPTHDQQDPPQKFGNGGSIRTGSEHHPRTTERAGELMPQTPSTNPVANPTDSTTTTTATTAKTADDGTTNPNTTTTTNPHRSGENAAPVVGRAARAVPAKHLPPASGSAGGTDARSRVLPGFTGPQGAAPGGVDTDAEAEMDLLLARMCSVDVALLDVLSDAQEVDDLDRLAILAGMSMEAHDRGMVDLLATARLEVSDLALISTGGSDAAPEDVPPSTRSRSPRGVYGRALHSGRIRPSETAREADRGRLALAVDRLDGDLLVLDLLSPAGDPARFAEARAAVVDAAIDVLHEFRDHGGDR